MKVSRPLLSAIAVSAILLSPLARTDESKTADQELTRRVLEVLHAAGCQSCHTEGKPAAKTRLRVPAREASLEQLREFQQGASRLVNAAEPNRSLLVMKPTFRVSHTGGRLIEPESGQDHLLRRWAEQLAKLVPAKARVAVHETSPATPARMLRRLTHSQYNNTVRDLLGDHSRIADRFPPEDFVNGFKNQVQTQSIPPLLAEAYGSAAEKLARAAFRGGDRQGLIPCTPSSDIDTACAEKFIRSFGRRAFRRPLELQEVQRYRELFLSDAAASENFLDRAGLVIEAMLQSPKFLLHLEPGSDQRHLPYVRASRLSYFLWNTMPDEPLLAAAESRGLDTVVGIEAQARRMLRDPRARESTEEFFSQWLRYDITLNTVRDRRIYRDFSPELAINMVEETRRLIADVVWNGKDFRGIFTAGYTYINSDLAKLYGVAVPVNEFDRVELPANSPRTGILGHSSFLTMTSKPAETSPTARGLFVREHLLCEKVPDPPPDASASLPPLTEDKPLANRDLLGVHLSSPTCAGCHNLIDPIGFGLENYDAVGRRREKQSITFFPNREEERRNKKVVTAELDIRPEGIVSGISDKPFTSPRELGELLAESPKCQECIVRQLFRYATGRQETESDQEAIDAAAKAFRESGFRFQELMVALVKSETFTGAKSASAVTGVRRGRK
jgi:hypothetical protein